MMPVVVPRQKHRRQDYRRVAGAVNCCGTETFESGVRLSFTPYGVPSGATQMLCASPWRPPMRTSWPLAFNAASTSGLTPPCSIEARSGSHW